MLKVKLLLLLLFYHFLIIVVATNDCRKNANCRKTTTTTTKPKQQQQQTKTRAGFVDDDASDVIHIIEPPQHFQQLKMIINQMDGVAQYDKLQNRTKTITTIKPNYRKITTNRQNSRHNNAKIESGEKLMKVRVKPTTMTVTKPTTTTTAATTVKAKAKRIRPMQQQTPKKQRRQPAQQQRQQPLSHIMRNMHTNNNSSVNIKQRHNGNDLDLLTQETHFAAMHHLPMEILASVRKTQNIVHKKRPILPVAPIQRLQTRRKHTVIMQQGFEREQHQRSQAEQLAAEKVHYNAVPHDNNNKSNKNHMKNSRSKRQTNVNATLSGNVVQHISELLAQSTKYLPNDNDDVDDNDKKKNQTTTKSKLARELSAKWLEDSLPKALIGEIEPYAEHNNAITADDARLYEFLESSVNVTDAILNELLQRQQQKPQLKKKHLRCKRSLLTHNLPTELSQRLRILQDKMQCMQQQQRIETAATNSKYVSRALPTSALAHARPHALTRQNRQFISNTKRHEAAADAQTHALLYDDVMSNIRYLLQTTIKPKVLDAPLALGVSDAALQFNDFNNLTHYIKRLGDVVEKLPYANSNNHNNNNNNNDDKKKSKQSSSNWFRISGEGNIQQHIDEALDALPAYTSIFHRFPDIPGAQALTTAVKSSH